MTKKIVLFIGLVLLICSTAAFAQVQQRIVQPIIINGQHAQGVLIIENGAVQTLTCQSPQSYTTENQSETGWACFDQTTGMWMLHAQAPAQPATVYSQPSSTYVVTPYNYYYPYPYYGYYPYAYPYGFYGWPTVGLGFGFGFGGHSHGIVHGRGPVVVGPGHFGGGHFGGAHMGGGHAFVGHGGGHR